VVVKSTVYYLPGWGGQLGTGLGQALMERGFDVAGRETRDDFKALSFTEQVQCVVQDLQQHFWSDGSMVVANSFGGYLFLHAQSQLPPYPGQVLLLSPIVGSFDDESRDMHFYPPQAERLFELIDAGQMVSPLHAEIHTGEHDWQSHPKAVQRLGEALGIPVHVVAGGEHRLPQRYVGDLLDRFLGS
jgi:pimeloyl-ACP methyl ester carboxylesterase